MRKILNSFILLFILSFIIVNTAKAQDSIEIEYFYGMDGYVLSSKGFPLHITVKNTGDDFSGDLVIKVPIQNDIVTNIKVDIDVLAQSEASYTIYLPGINSQTIRPIVTLYKGDYQNGKEESFSGSNVLVPKYYSPGATVIGTFTSTIERTKFLESMKEVNKQVLLTKDNFPNDSLGLEMFSAIFVDDLSLDLLTDEQLASLQEWMNRGGILISSSLPNQSVDFLPFTVNEALQLHANWQWGTDTFSQSMRVFDVTPNENTEVITNDQGLVIGKQKIGNGAIIQVNYVLGDNPLISWESYPAWFASHLEKAEMNLKTDLLTTQTLIGNTFSLNRVTEIFKATSVSLEVMSLLLIGYLFLVTTVVYLFLKKKNKLELAWGIIPIIAIVSSIVIFIVGAKDRFFESKINQVAVYTNFNGYTNGVVVSNLLTNKGGDVALTINEQVPIYTIDSRGFLSNLNAHNGMLEMGSKEATISFTNTNYWSTVSAASLVEQESIGNFETNLQVTNGYLQGTITNHYPIDFTDLAVWSGSDLYELPSIKENETVEVNIKLNSSLLSRPNYLDLNYGNAKDMKEIKLEGLNSYIQNTISTLDNKSFNKPAILAQTDQLVHSFSLNKGNYSMDSLSYFYEPIDITLMTEGEVIIQSEQLNHEHSVISGGISNFEKDGQWYFVDPGEYEFTYDLPEDLHERTVVLKEVESHFSRIDSTMEFLLYDFNNNEYIVLGEQKLVAKEDQNFIQNNQLKLKLITSSEYGGDITLPQLEMKLEVSK